jgi:CBS domain-containing protein
MLTGMKTELMARDVMIFEPVCVDRSDTIWQLARVFVEHEISGAPVVDQQGRLVGVVSRTDLVRRCLEGTADIPPAYLFEVIFEQGADDEAAGADVIRERLICVEDCMTQDPVTASPETPVGTIASLMFDGRIHRVIVVDEERFPVGIITSLDLLALFPQAEANVVAA